METLKQEKSKEERLKSTDKFMFFNTDGGNLMFLKKKTSQNKDLHIKIVKSNWKLEVHSTPIRGLLHLWVPITSFGKHCSRLFNTFEEPTTMKAIL